MHGIEGSAHESHRLVICPSLRLLWCACCSLRRHSATSHGDGVGECVPVRGAVLDVRCYGAGVMAKNFDEMTVAELMSEYKAGDAAIVSDRYDGAPGYQGIEGRINFLSDRLLLACSVLHALGNKVAANENKP